ncbi:MAG: hypothetical protein QF357_04820 [Dehalococcoidia bacterium]|jgi:hypothetical protein|nr:hypothetical protein [Dehalococcoidia bacterium]
MILGRTAGLVVVLLAVLVIPLLAGCGSGDSGVTGDSAGDDAEPVLKLQPDGVFTVDDVAAAGWKKSKELSPETLPGATGAWYGFYNQRDVEVRIYASHDSALSDGMDPADDATGRGKPAPFAVGGISATRTSYVTYAIVGNLILLCEVKIEDCQGLLDGIQ